MSVFVPSELCEIFNVFVYRTIPEFVIFWSLVTAALYVVPLILQ